MTDKVQMNLNVKKDTKRRVKEIGLAVDRGPGDVIDWLVAEAWDKIQEAHRESTTVEQARTQPQA